MTTKDVQAYGVTTKVTGSQEFVDAAEFTLEAMSTVRMAYDWFTMPLAQYVEKYILEHDDKRVADDVGSAELYGKTEDALTAFLNKYGTGGWGRNSTTKFS